jgi:hypothetical protein
MFVGTTVDQFGFSGRDGRRNSEGREGYYFSSRRIWYNVLRGGDRPEAGKGGERRVEKDVATRRRGWGEVKEMGRVWRGVCRVKVYRNAVSLFLPKGTSIPLYIWHGTPFLDAVTSFRRRLSICHPTLTNLASRIRYE